MHTTTAYHERDSECAHQQVKLVPFPLLRTEPVHEEAELQVRGEHCSDHHRNEPESYQARAEPENESERADRLCDDDKERDR